MERRIFTHDLLFTLTSIALLDTLFKNDLFTNTVKPISARWLKALHEMCKDLKTNKISPTAWQTKIAEFHRRLPLEDLIQTIDFDHNIKNFQYPDLGVVTRDPQLPQIEGVSERYAFAGRIFGMLQDRAIIPHGHRNMVSCHRVLQGAVLLRQYDRVKDEGNYLFIKPTIEELGKKGSFSSISDDQNNIHWLVATTPKAFTFDVIVSHLNNKPYEIDNIDIHNAEKVGSDLLRVKTLTVEEGLKKYGKTHH